MASFRLTFILPDHCRDESEASEVMLQAYETSKSLVKEIRWAREKELNTKELTKMDYLIFDDLATGRSFKEFADTKCIILGPWALSVCFLENKPIPVFTWPMHNVAFYDCNITCSHISKPAKAEIKEKVQLMGGSCTPTLTGETTHLVTDTVNSAKYISAAQSGKKIMLPSWIDAVWEASQKNNVHADDEKFENHRCLPFQNLTICTTGISSASERSRLTKAITSNGGTFSPALKLANTDILVCHGVECNESAKFKAARMSQSVKCVTLNWVYDSIQKGYALPPDKYHVKRATSSPFKEAEKPDPNFSTVSAIAEMSIVSNRTTVDETLVAAANSSVFKSKKRKSQYAHLVEGIDFKKIKQSGHFLEHCSIYVVGFEAEDREKLNKAISLSGATRYNGLSDYVTHVIVGDTSSQEVQQILSKGYHCCVVTIQWFLDSMVQQRPVNEDNYIVKAVDCEGTNMGSPLSKKGLSLLRTDKTMTKEALNVTGECSKDTYQNESTSNSPKPLKHPEMPGAETLAELIRNEDDFTNFTTTKNDNVVNTKTVTEVIENKPNSSQKDETSQDTCTITQEYPSDLFRGLKFTILEYASEVYDEFKGVIENCGGTVVPRTFKGIPDYAVVPIFPASVINPTAQETVSEIWLTDCLSEGALVEILYYHRPFVLKDNQPLTNCVVTISGYSKSERGFLKDLVGVLGGVDQDSLARKTNIEKGIVACTHLISMEASGKKYEAAQKWKIPVVTKDWLLECAKTAEYQPETRFIVGESSSEVIVLTSCAEQTLKSNVTKAKESTAHCDAITLESGNTAKSGQTPSRPSTTSTKVLTPVNRKLTCEENADSMKTPVNQVYRFKAKESPAVNSQITPISKIMQEARDKKLLNAAVESPQTYGPWNAKTPETPYGAFMMPNPTREVRKEMVAFMNQFPDFSPPKKRLSTPLSEIKRKMRIKFGGGECSQLAAAPAGHEELNLPDTVLSEVARQNLSDRSEEISTKEADNVTINNKLLQLEEMMTAQGTSSKNRRSSRAFQPTKNPEPAVTGEAISQVCTVGWDFREDEQHDTHDQDSPKIFMVSGLPEAVKKDVESKINSLGGVVLDQQNFNPTITHLICIRTARCEKILASMASGKWILHQNYVEESYKAGRFLDEEDFEFGNSKSSENINNEYADEETRNRNKSIVYWRKTINKRGYGAFHEMRMIVVAYKRDQLVRVIEAGGGVVVNVSPPFDDTVHATHCLLEPKAVTDFSVYEPLAQQGIQCVAPTYLCSFLNNRNKDANDSILPYFTRFSKKQ